MKSVEIDAKTVDEAVNQALAELNATIDQVEYEILDSGSRGILGLGARNAKVKVMVNITPADAAIDFIKPFLAVLGINPNHEFEEKEEDMLWISFSGEDLGSLIGRRGETLDALQYLTNLAVNKQFDYKTRIILDVEGYRETREKTLASLALKMANKVRKTRRNVVLEPMSPHERWVLHVTLQNEPDIRTLSEGSEPYRRVIITRRRGNKK